MINFCKTNGAFDPVTMGSVPNVGLMAQKAEEYGSHDKTFEMKYADGTMRVVLADGTVLMQHEVESDIWRACQTKDAPIATGSSWPLPAPASPTPQPSSGWTGACPRHAAAEEGRNLSAGARPERPGHSHHGLQRSHSPEHGAHDPRPRTPFRHRQRAARLPDRPVPDHGAGHLGQDAVHRSADGRRRHVRDWRRFTPRSTCSSWSKRTICAGIRWASSSPWRFRWRKPAGNNKAKILGKTDQATGKLLDNNKSPARKVGQIDNRGSHFYLALYWAQALAAQDEDAELKAHFLRWPRPDRAGSGHRR